MHYPLEFTPQRLHRPLFNFFLLLTIAIFGIFYFIDQPLQTSAAPSGTVSFELARTPETARSILDSWDANARLIAAFGLGFDFLFMPVYALALSFGLLLAGHGKANWYRRLTMWMGWGAFAAALFDAVENYALLRVLIGDVDTVFPLVAAVCALTKFTLLLFGICTAAIGRMAR